MNQPKSTVIRRKTRKISSLRVCYRLLRSADTPPVYSVFLSTSGKSSLDEAFAPAIAHDKATALRFFEKIVAGGVTACTLQDVAEDFAHDLILP